jgi:DNA-binding transcriptional ArsR family regulator
MQGVLAATVLRPEHEWYLSGLAAHLGLGPSSLQRTLAQLTRAGILNRRRNGNRVYYRADSDCPIREDLAGMLTETIGVADPLRAALMPLADPVLRQDCDLLRPCSRNPK